MYSLYGRHGDVASAEIEVFMAIYGALDIFIYYSYMRIYRYRCIGIYRNTNIDVNVYIDIDKDIYIYIYMRQTRRCVELGNGSAPGYIW